MGFMKFDKEKGKKADSMFGLIDEGTYEMFVQKAEYRPSKKGSTPNINLSLVIRSDVDQEFKGRMVFHTFWLSEKSPEAAEVCENMIMSFLDKIGTPEGMDFGTPQEVAAYMVAKPIIGQVITTEYNGKDRSEISTFSISEYFGEEVDVEAAGPKKKTESLEKTSKKETNYANTKVDDDPFANDNGSIDISDDDLPF